MGAYSPVIDRANDFIARASVDARTASSLTHLEQLEAESIHIIREAVAESENPVMLYSIGKDSSVLLHLALKAFYPAKPPFPLLHVDTTWKFREMIAFRDGRVRERQSRGARPRHRSNHQRIGNSHRRHEDTGLTAGAGPSSLRRRFRRRSPG
jgi:3'-phosphoadenosine 5'-phosphosulfate sulfotransferase (PAPS reductase)/FAD synthetase